MPRASACCPGPWIQSGSMKFKPVLFKGLFIYIYSDKHISINTGIYMIENNCIDQLINRVSLILLQVTVFSIIALLRNSHTLNFTLLNATTVQCLILERFCHSEKKPCIHQESPPITLLPQPQNIILILFLIFPFSNFKH